MKKLDSFFVKTLFTLGNLLFLWALFCESAFDLDYVSEVKLRNIRIDIPESYDNLTHLIPVYFLLVIGNIIYLDDEQVWY